ncbi:MAG TPA: hypothetical protein VF133_15575 [Terriglobales bacterium]|jgi:hypothetical protein
MGTIKMFLGIFMIVGGLYASIKIVPPYFENYQFQDAIKDEAVRDSYSPKSEDEIRDTIVKKAQEFDIPLAPENVHVTRQGNQFSGTVIIHAAYVVHVDMPGYPMDLHFDASTENKGVF